MQNEKRLIDANAGKKRFVAIGKSAEYNGVLHMVVPISEIDKLPTVDAVEVVRCKDCAHMRKLPQGRYCDVWHMFNGMGDEGFCNYGERRVGK